MPEEKISDAIRALPNIREHKQGVLALHYAKVYDKVREEAEEEGLSNAELCRRRLAVTRAHSWCVHFYKEVASKPYVPPFPANKKEENK